MRSVLLGRGGRRFGPVRPRADFAAAARVPGQCPLHHAGLRGPPVLDDRSRHERRVYFATRRVGSADR
eukprot:144748-Pyramimonas_sp.AAC.1